MISLYQPGNSFLHKTPAGVKLIGLAIIALGLFFVPPSYWASAVFLLIPVSGYALAGLGAKTLWTDFRRLFLLLVFLIVTQLIFLTPVQAATNTTRVIAIILLAQIMTRTTRTDGIINSAEKIFGPLRRFGANPEKIGLAVALVLSSLGQISAFIQQVRNAQAARGTKIPPWSWVVPVLVLSLKHADDVADALIARGQFD